MKCTFFFICLLTTVTGQCQNSSEEPCPLVSEQAAYTVRWYFKDTFGILHKDTQYYKIARRGPGIIFRYQKKFDCPDISDEQYSEDLRWTIPDSVSEFTIDLASHPSSLQYGLYHWMSRYELHSISGIIHGKRYGKEWLVSADIQLTAIRKHDNIQYNRIVQFTKTFPAWEDIKKRKKKKMTEDYVPFYEDIMSRDKYW